MYANLVGNLWLSNRWITHGSPKPFDKWLQSCYLLSLSGGYLVDCHARTLDCTRAFMGLQGSLTCPIYYWGLCDTMRNDGINEADWATDHMKALLAQEMSSGQLVPRGVEIPPETSTNDLGHVLEKPPLSVCTWNDKDGPCG